MSTFFSCLSTQGCASAPADTDRRSSSDSNLLREDGSQRHILLESGEKPPGHRSQRSGSMSGDNDVISRKTKFVFRSRPIPDCPYEPLKVILFLAAAEGYHHYDTDNKSSAMSPSSSSSSSASMKSDPRLSNKGVEQCKLVCKYLRQAQQSKPDLILCSSLYRALSTMKLVCADWYGIVECKVLDSLRPIFDFDWSNHRSPLPDLRAVFPRETQFFVGGKTDNHAERYGIGAPETVEQLHRRIQKFLCEHMIPDEARLYSMETVLRRFEKKRPNSARMAHTRAATQPTLTQPQSRQLSNASRHSSLASAAARTPSPEPNYRGSRPEPRTPQARTSTQAAIDPTELFRHIQTKSVGSVCDDRCNQLHNVRKNNSTPDLPQQVVVPRGSLKTRHRHLRVSSSTGQVMNGTCSHCCEDDEHFTDEDIIGALSTGSSHFLNVTPKRLVVVSHREFLDPLFRNVAECSQELLNPWKHCDLRKVFVYSSQQLEPQPDVAVHRSESQEWLDKRRVDFDKQPSLFSGSLLLTKQSEEKQKKRDNARFEQFQRKHVAMSNTLTSAAAILALQQRQSLSKMEQTANTLSGATQVLQHKRRASAKLDTRTVEAATKTNKGRRRWSLPGKNTSRNNNSKKSLQLPTVGESNNWLPKVIKFRTNKSSEQKETSFSETGDDSQSASDVRVIDIPFSDETGVIRTGGGRVLSTDIIRQIRFTAHQQSEPMWDESPNNFVAPMSLLHHSAAAAGITGVSPKDKLPLRQPNNGQLIPTIPIANLSGSLSAGHIGIKPTNSAPFSAALEELKDELEDEPSQTDEEPSSSLSTNSNPAPASLSNTVGTHTIPPHNTLSASDVRMKDNSLTL